MMYLPTSLVILYLLEILGSSPVNGLFFNNSDVITLKEKHFSPKVLQANHMTLLTFYVPWCLKCLPPYPQTMKRFARSIRSWRNIIRVASINCENNKICRDFGVGEMPVNIIVPPRTKKLAPVVNVSLPNNVEDFKNYILDQVLNNTHLANRKFLQSMSVRNKDELCDLLEDDDDLDEDIPVFLLLERNPTHNSAKLILDLQSYWHFVRLKRFQVDEIAIYSILETYPSLPVILKANYEQCSFNLFMSNSRNNAKELMAQFRLYLANEFPQIVPTDEEADDEIFARRTKPYVPRNLSYIDLDNTLRYSLLHEVSRQKLFNITQFRVLRQNFITLYRYFPFRNENVRRLFKRMNIWFLKERSNMSVVTYIEAMRISDGFLKPKENWYHCNGSLPHYRGYPCGLWTLFHTLTVSEYQNYTQRNKGEQMVHEVLPTMVNYIANFYNCRSCREYFLRLAEGMPSELNHANSSVLWLWRVHNLVNYRLHGGLNEDPFHPKIQFPSREVCPKCYCQNCSDNEFVLTEVFQFLLRYYDRKTIISSSNTINIDQITLISSFTLIWFLSY